MGTDPRISAVVGEGVTGQQLADHGWMTHGITGALDTGMEWVQYTAAGLIIAGGAVTSEPIAARWFRAASPATVRIWVVPHAGHTAGLADAPQAWTAHVLSFLNTPLLPATQGRSGTAS